VVGLDLVNTRNPAIDFDHAACISAAASLPDGVSTEKATMSTVQNRDHGILGVVFEVYRILCKNNNRYVLSA